MSYLHVKLQKHGKRLQEIKLSDLRQWLSEDPNRTKGEMVLIVEGKPKSEDSDEFAPQAIKALTLIAKELPFKKSRGDCGRTLWL